MLRCLFAEQGKAVEFGIWSVRQSVRGDGPSDHVFTFLHQLDDG